VWLYLRRQTRSTEELHVIKEIAEKDCESWRVVKLLESDKVSVSEDKGFEGIDVLVPVSVVKQGSAALTTQN
jgi:hypothetical protein